MPTGFALTPTPITTFQKLVSLGARLAELPDPLASSLEAAARLLDRCTVNEILSSAIHDRSRLESLTRIVSGLDHVGLLVPPVPLAEASAVAAAAGFDAWNSTFPSTILARELGELAGTGVVPTTVLKVCGTAPNGGPRLVEVFMPQAEAPLVRDWMRRGVGLHVAFAIRQDAQFAAVTQLLRPEGFLLPEFMIEKPLRNPIERITTLYYDGHVGADPIRIEFCCYD